MSSWIERGYPRLPLHEKVKAYIQLVRPFTLVAPLAAGTFLTLAPAVKRGVSLADVHYAVYAGVTLAILQAVGQIVNQYADADLDRVAKPYRPIPRGAVDRDEAMGLAVLLSIFGIARAFTVSTQFGLWCLALLFFAVFYSLPPLSPRRVSAWLNHAWVTVSRGFLPVMACYTVYGSPGEAVELAALGTIIVFGWQGSKDVVDVEADRMFGIKTIANTVGVGALKAIAAASAAAVAVWSALTGRLAMLALVPLMAYGVARYEKKSGLTENTVGWTVFYLSLSLFYMLALVGELL